MPGTAPPQGHNGFYATLQGFLARLSGLEAWQRQARTIAAGTITQYGGATPPAGSLACNGATFDGTQYPALAAALGSTTLPNIAGTPIWIIWT